MTGQALRYVSPPNPKALIGRLARWIPSADADGAVISSGVAFIPANTNQSLHLSFHFINFMYLISHYRQREGKKKLWAATIWSEQTMHLKKQNKTLEQNDFNDIQFLLRFLNISILVLMWTECQRKGKIIVNFTQVVSLNSELNVTRMLNRH